MKRLSRQILPLALACCASVIWNCGGRIDAGEGPGPDAGRDDTTVRDASPDRTSEPSTPDASVAKDASREGGETSATTMATSYLVNPAHTSAITDPTLAPPLAQLWSVDYVGMSVQYPLIAEGSVYLLLKSNSQAPSQLASLDERSGATLWGPLNLDGLYIEGHAYDRSRVFTVASETGLVQAFYNNNGAVAWTTMVSGTSEGDGPPTAYDGVLYIVGPGAVTALDDTSGALLWSDTIGIPEDTSPAVTDDGVFVSGGCGETYAFDRLTGDVLWHYAPGCDSGFSGTPIVFGGRVYLVQGGGTSTLALDARTGKVLPSPSFTTSPAFDGHSAFFTTGSVLEGLDLSSGQTSWKFEGDMAAGLIPFVAAGTVYVPSSTGKMLAVDESTGVETWSAQFDSVGVARPPVGAEGVLVTVLYDGSEVVGYGHVDLPDASVALGDGAPPTPIVLASGESSESLALGATNVYWTDGNTGEVLEVPEKGGPSSVVNAAADTEPWGIAVDSTRVYWTAPNFAFGGTPTVMSMPLQGGSATTLATGVQGTSIVVGSGNVYWASSGPDAVESVPVEGGAITAFGSEPNGATALAIDAKNLYWCAGDGIFQEALGAGPAISIGPAAAAVAVDGTDVYYVTNSIGGNSVARVPIGGGNPTVLATGRIGSLVAVAVDGQNVYWLEGEGTIQQGAVAALPKTGGRVVVLASGLSDPTAIAVDDSGIYFTAGGPIEKIAK